MSEYRNTLLISPSELKTLSIINANVADEYLSAAILNAQELYLNEIIGTALYYRLQELVYNQIQGVSPKIEDADYAKYKELLHECVQPFLKAKATIGLLYDTSFKVRNMGVTRSNDNNLSAASMSDIKYLENQYSTSVDTYAQKMSMYLNDNFFEFEELLSDELPSWYLSPSINKRYGNCSGLWLGDKKSNTSRKNNCGW